MINTTPFVETLVRGANNPDCAFYVGASGGMLLGIWAFSKFILMLIVCYIVLQFINKLAFEPFLEWLKNKIYGGNKK